MEIINPRRIAYPEFRGNGVFASLGNVFENPRMGLIFIDFFETTVGLHVNGSVQICPAEHAPAELDSREYRDRNRKSLLERWLVIDIDEAYIHCSKHVPLLEKVDKRIDWGTDDPKSKSDDFFLVEGPD